MKQRFFQIASVFLTNEHFLKAIKMIQPPSNWPISGAINRLLTCCLLAACLAAPNAVNGDLITVNSVTDTHEIVDAVNPGNSVSGTGNTITGNMGSHSAGGFSTSYSSEYSNTPFSTPRHTTPHIGENVDAHFAIKYDFDLAHTASIGPDSYARARNEVDLEMPRMMKSPTITTSFSISKFLKRRIQR